MSVGEGWSQATRSYSKVTRYLLGWLCAYWIQPLDRPCSEHCFHQLLQDTLLQEVLRQNLLCVHLPEQ